jgi:hypothetical protein
MRLIEFYYNHENPHDLDYYTFWKRVQDGQEPKWAMAKPSNGENKYAEYVKWIEVAKKNKVNIITFKNRVFTSGWSAKEAATVPALPRGMSRKAYYESLEGE